MPLTQEECAALKSRAKEIRKDIARMTGWSGGAHIGGSLSMVEILTILYWKYLKHDAKNPDWEERDRFVLSKGHGGAGHAVALAHAGYFDPEELKYFNKDGSNWGMHLDSKKAAGVEVSTGSMGHGLPQAVGLALGARVKKADWTVYAVMGDGECNEGSIWEAAMAAAHYKLGNLIGFVDRNRMMIDGPTEKVMGLGAIADKWTAFGWKTVTVNGHDYNELAEAIEAAQAYKDGPFMIVANTIKGKGIDYMEDNPAWHYGGLSTELVEKAIASIDKME